MLGQIPVAPSPKSSFRRTRRFIAFWSRWLHIYLSLLSLGTIFFFSVTGLTLNHPDWFFSETTIERTGTLPRNWLDLEATPPANWDGRDYSHQVDRLAVVEFLRATHGLRCRVTDFLIFEDECSLSFEGPGYAAATRIDRSTGQYSVMITCNDLISILNDLHKGRHSGGPWSILIDVSAVLSALVSLSGFLLIFFLRLRRTAGLIAALIGAMLFLMMVWIAVR